MQYDLDDEPGRGDHRPHDWRITIIVLLAVLICAAFVAVNSEPGTNPFASPTIEP